MTLTSKYPRQIAVIKRKELTLSVEANFELAGAMKNSKGEEVMVPPLTMHGPRSCFKWTIIDTSGVQPIYPSANLPFDDVPTFGKRVDAVIKRNVLMGNMSAKEENQKASPGYTVKLRMKEFKGKTPASILLEDRNQKDRLLNMADYLRSQGEQSRYWESNLQQIEAIEDAVEQLERGTLSAEMTEKDSFSVYDIPQKILENRPPKGDTKEHFFVYSFQIKCLNGYEYPWQVSIRNFYCKIKRMSNEMIQTIPQSAILQSSSEIMLSDYEMGYIADQIVNRKNNFEQAYFARQYKASAEQERILRESFTSDSNNRRVA